MASPKNNFPEKQPYNPDNTDLCDDAFQILKYVLRSYRENGLLDQYVRNVYIVHSDLHNPPCYFQEMDKLHFIKHSDIFWQNQSDVTDTSRSSNSNGLPNFNRNSIESNYHRIPGLLDWYLICNDDYLLMDTFRLDDFVTLNGTRHYLSRGDLSAGTANDGYMGAMIHSAKILQNLDQQDNVSNTTTSNDSSSHNNHHRKRKPKYGETHMPYMVWKPAIEKLESLFPQLYIDTSRNPIQKKTDIHPSVLYQNYMIDLGLGVRANQDDNGFGGMLHTNAICNNCDGIQKDFTDQQMTRIERFLHRATAKTWRWINLQGQGFDDGYRFRKKKREYSPKVKNMSRAFFNQWFPKPNIFEN